MKQVLGMLLIEPSVSIITYQERVS